MKIPKQVTSKEQARELAVDWQHWQSKRSMSYDEVHIWQVFFVEIAERFSLVEEFTENGII